LYRVKYIDILNRVGVDYECDRQTDRQTEPHSAIALSNLVRRALKVLVRFVLQVEPQL